MGVAVGVLLAVLITKGHVLLIHVLRWPVRDVQPLKTARGMSPPPPLTPDWSSTQTIPSQIIMKERASREILLKPPWSLCGT